jgi:hypothetical protein
LVVSPTFTIFVAMTVDEMHIAFNLGLQRMNANAYDTFLNEEIDFFLNRAQDRFIKERTNVKSDPRRDGFEGSQKRLDDIRVLVQQNFNETFPAQEGAQWIQGDLPVNYIHLVTVQADVHYNRCGDVTTSDPSMMVPVRVVDNAEVYTMNRNPFAKSNIDSPMATVSRDDLKVYQDGKSFILKGITLDYIRKPRVIDLSLNQDCELAEHTHQEIVDIAVKNVLEAIESPRYQTNSAEQLKSE